MAEKKSRFEKLTETMQKKQGISTKTADKEAAAIGNKKYGARTMERAAGEHISAEAVRKRNKPKKVG